MSGHYSFPPINQRHEPASGGWNYGYPTTTGIAGTIPPTVSAIQTNMEDYQRLHSKSHGYPPFPPPNNHWPSKFHFPLTLAPPMIPFGGMSQPGLDMGHRPGSANSMSVGTFRPTHTPSSAATSMTIRPSAAAAAAAAVVTPMKQSPPGTTHINHVTFAHKQPPSAPREQYPLRPPPPQQQQQPHRLLLEVLLELPQSSREYLVFVATHMKRSSLEHPWGLGLVVTESDRRVFLSNVKFGPNVETCWTKVIPAKDTSHLLFRPNTIYDHNVIYNENSNKHSLYLSKLLEATKYSDDQDTASELQRQICAGDLVVAIDGRPISEFENLEHVTAHLRKSRSVCIVLARFQFATSAVIRKDESNPFQIASTANTVWKEILPVTTSPKFSFGIPPEGTLLVGPQKHFCQQQRENQQQQTKEKQQLHRQQVLNRPSLYTVLKKPPTPPVRLRNPWFKQEDGQNIPYDDEEDDDNEYNIEDGTRAGMFLPPIDNFQEWLLRRKSMWRGRYKVYRLKTTPAKEYHKRASTKCIDCIDEIDVIDRASSSISVNFWSSQGFSSFDEWLATRIVQWKLNYSWNKRKRKRIQQDCEEVVHLPSQPSTNEFEHWLSVRRHQWRLLRRKRQRLRGENNGDGKILCTITGKVSSNSSEYTSLVDTSGSTSRPEEVSENFTEITNSSHLAFTSRSKLQLLSSDDKELVFLDEILEAEEEESRKRAERQSSIDIRRFFDASNGIPDDIIVQCLEYLDRKEHGKMLAIDRNTSKSLKNRQCVWKSLCPKHWTLPRRPRKPWHELYFTKLRTEHELHQKRWDDLLVKCAAALESGDLLQKVQNLVTKAEKDFGFDVNYCSGVVCERNGLLNLAVIQKRHKVVRWLVEKKNADIETVDRGYFTPLLNSAFSGDRFLVRYFLQKGADRNVRGTQHYSQGIAPASFKGLKADEWAEKRGFDDIAKLIKLGL